MLIYIYLASLIVGGVLLGASIVLGGQDDADLEAGGDLDLEADGLDAGEVEADGELEPGGDGALSGVLVAFLSLRFWTFFSAFFGLTGLVLGGLGLVASDLLGLGLALAMGLSTGLGATAVIRRLSADTSGRAVRSGDYVGKTARVVVPFEGRRVGKVRVDIRGNSVDLLASGFDEETYDGKQEVLIVEMDGSRARVARLDGGGDRSERG